MKFTSSIWLLQMPHYFLTSSCFTIFYLFGTSYFSWMVTFLPINYSYLCLMKSSFKGNNLIRSPIIIWWLQSGQLIIYYFPSIINISSGFSKLDINISESTIVLQHCSLISFIFYSSSYPLCLTIWISY
jgi:hypothetical protein